MTADRPEAPTCSCGSAECAGGPKRLLFPCAGIANVGQLTNRAALQLADEGYGSPACIALLATGTEGIRAAAKDADAVIVLDGCPTRCASKIARAQKVPAFSALVVTDLGIAKGPSPDYTDDDVETVVAAVWEGRTTDE